MTEKKTPTVITKPTASPDPALAAALARLEATGQDLNSAAGVVKVKAADIAKVCSALRAYIEA